MPTQKAITRPIIVLMLAALLLAACSPMAAPAPEPREVFMESAAPAAVAESAAGQSANIFASNDTAQTIERLVIKNASLSLVVNDPPESMNRISALAEELGGFVVSANLFHMTLDSGQEVPQASIAIRVPAEKLSQALDRIRAESDREPQREEVNSQDVTKDYTDQQSRLRNLEAAEAQLTEIMGSATRTEDVLAVYNQLVQVREQIEITKGQIKYYEESAALSLISVELVANEAIQPLTIGGWEPVGVAKDAIQALINGLEFLVNAAIWVVLFVLPVLLVFYVLFILPLTLFIRMLRRRRARSRQAAPPPPHAPPASKT